MLWFLYTYILSHIILSRRNIVWILAWVKKKWYLILSVCFGVFVSEMVYIESVSAQSAMQWCVFTYTWKEIFLSVTREVQRICVFLHFLFDRAILVKHQVGVGWGILLSLWLYIFGLSGVWIFSCIFSSGNTHKVMYWFLILISIKVTFSLSIWTKEIDDFFSSSLLGETCIWQLRNAYHVSGCWLIFVWTAKILNIAVVYGKAEHFNDIWWIPSTLCTLLKIISWPVVILLHNCW